MARWLLWLVAVVSITAATQSAAAQTTACATPTDCDADGTNNFDDPCPALSGTTATAASTGFVDIGCYLPFVPPLSSCIPVAARPFDDMVPDDAFRPLASSTHRRGFTYVGIYDTASGGPAAAAPYLNQADAARAGGGPRPLFAPNTLFACFGSVEFNSDGSAKAPGPTVYGFRIASAYARSVNTAAVQAQDLGFTSFRDALGLVEDVRVPGAPSETPGERPGVIGTAGTLDDSSLWSTDSWVIVEPLPGNLPKVERLFYTPACIDPKVPRVPRTPFGYEPMVPSTVPQSSPAYVDKFMADEFKSPGIVNQVDLTGCGTNPESEAYVFYSHSVIALPSISLFGITIGGGQIDLWWIDQPYVWVRAVEQFAGGLPLRTFSAPRVALREPRPNWGPPFTAVSAGGAVLFNDAATQDWRTAGGAAYSALQALGLDGRPLSAFSQADVGGSRQISATLRAWNTVSETYDQATGGWLYRGAAWEGQPNQVNANVPLSANPDTAHYSFAAGATDGHLNAHFWADKWHPAGDYWEANGQGPCSTLSSRFPRTLTPNPAVDVASEWCPHIPSGARPYIDTYENRVNLCDVKHFNANDPERHWPLIGTRVPFATLYGHLYDPDAPTGHFPDSDFIHSGLKNMRRMHEGMDFNWEMKEAYADPTTRDIFGKFDANYCWGTFVLTEDLQLPISCNDKAMELCGELAGPIQDGCNPTELAKARFDQSVSDFCSCHTKRCGNPIFDAFCTITNCVLNTAAVCIPGVALSWLNYIHDVFAPYITSVCVAWNGTQSCNDPTQTIGLGPYVLHRGVPFKPGKREMEDEIEYNVAFGVRDIGLGRQTDCAGGFGFASTCDWNNDNSTYHHNNWVYGDEDDTLVTVGTNKETQPWSFTSIPPLPNTIWPTVFGPGIFQTGSGVWGKVADLAAHNATYLSYSAVPATPVLSPDVAALRTNEPGIEHPFRLELLGDLIVDCGHHPLRPEIHPPAGAYLHLGGPGRYSLFAWQRPITPDVGRDVVVDLWPAQPRPSASSRLKCNVIYDRGILVDTGETPGKWVCIAYPINAPDRYRCTMFAEGRPIEVPGDFVRCFDNFRMMPSCHDGVAGGIVEVSWQ